MYGTVAHFRAKPGTEEQLIKHLQEFENAQVPGTRAIYLYRMDADSNEHYEAVVFSDKEAYLANAASPEQDTRYQQYRALLETDPEWHDGEIVYALEPSPAQKNLDIQTLRQAIEQRQAEALMNFYADDASIQIVDHVSQPSSPHELKGKEAIANYLHDICSREMTHKVIDEVIGTDRMFFHEACQYPSGERVLAASMFDLENGKIVRQITLQAWDEEMPVKLASE